jgi:hypothetical protein
MHEKKSSLIIAFANTTEAMGVEKFCTEHGLPGRLIPIPREITAGCGLAWKAPPEEKERLAEALSSAKLPWAKMCVIEI